MNIHPDILSLIGNTPLVRLARINAGLSASLFAKLEFFNPLGSSKDRIARAMIEDGEKQGKINDSTTIIEPTSGNTGIALAAICAVKGYRIILTMPGNMSAERICLLKMLGAEVVLTPAEKGLKGAVEKAAELAREIPFSYIPGQFTNPVNPRAHYLTTAEELWRDTAGKIDQLVCGIGTGGTITGIARKLREYKKHIKIIGVEPASSAVLSGKKAGCHGIPGIGAGFVPEVLDRSLLDEVITVTDEEALKTTRELARKEGISAGISSGAALWAARESGRRKDSAGAAIIIVFPDSAERCLSLIT